MAGEDLTLQIVIDTIANAKGFEEAQAGLATLTTTTNATATATKAAAGSQAVLTTEQRVSSREVKILTRELLMGIGATQGAGAAGRVAANAYRLLGDSAEFANLAIAGVGLAAVLLLPKLIEWISTTGKAAEENAKVVEEVASLSEHLQSLVTKFPSVTAAFKEWAAAVHQVALDQEAIKIQQLFEEMKKLSEEASKAPGAWDRFLTSIKHPIDQFRIWEQVLLKHAGTSKADKDAIAALMQEVYKRSEALGKGITLQELENKVEKEGEQRKKGLKISEEAYTEAIKRWEFAEKSAALARDRQKKQETEEIARETKIIQLLKQEANARRAAAKAAMDAAADEIEAENVKQQQIMDLRKNALVTGLAAASMAFGKHKAIAIALALAETYKAASEALASPPGPPWSIPLMVATVAMGLANVANIQKSNVGFDDPFNDVLASQLGRKSAADFVEHFGAGFREGMGGGRGGTSIQNTTINRGTTMNVTANGIIGSRSAFRSWLEREMTLATRGRVRKTI